MRIAELEVGKLYAYMPKGRRSPRAVVPLDTRRIERLRMTFGTDADTMFREADGVRTSSLSQKGVLVLVLDTPKTKELGEWTMGGYPAEEWHGVVSRLAELEDFRTKISFGRHGFVQFARQDVPQDIEVVLPQDIPALFAPYWETRTRNEQEAEQKTEAARRIREEARDAYFTTLERLRNAGIDTTSFSQNYQNGRVELDLQAFVALAEKLG